MKRLTSFLAVSLLAAAPAGAQDLEASLAGATAGNLPQALSEFAGEPVLAAQAASVERMIVTQGGTGGMPDDARFRANYGAGFDAVVSLRIQIGAQFFGCTGTLLPNRTQILTAAHCVTSGSGVVTASNVDVRFQGPSNTFEQTLSVGGTGISVMPGYGGAVFENEDLAILTLPSAAPAFAASAPIFGGPASAVLNQTITVAGYGSTGTGTTGDAQPGFAFRRRFGYNRFEATCNADAGCVATNNATRQVWMSDFDNGSGAGNLIDGYNANAICRFFGVPEASFAQLCNRGVTTVTGSIFDEVGIGRGDSGGPAFFNGFIVGVASWGARLDSRYAFGGFGTLAGHVNVLAPTNLQWIQQQTGFTSVVPEPSTYALLGAGLVGLGAVARRRRRA